jgi:hypothetical protein
MMMSYPFLHMLKNPDDDAVEPLAFLELVSERTTSPTETTEFVRSNSPVSKPQRPNKSRKGKRQGGSGKPHKG